MLKKLQLLTLFVAITFASFGQDWIEVSSGLPSGIGIGQISVGMDNSDAIWASAINDDGSSNDAFTRSTDGGQTWTAGTFNAGTGLSMIFAIDANTCWAVFNTGANQGLYKTEDGGSTWTKKGTAYGSSSFANVIHFFNDNEGFAQGDPLGGYFELYTTTDGGESWTRVPESNIPAPVSGEYGITGNYSAAGNSIWFGTNMGRIYYSSDKGSSWGVTETPFGSTNVVQPLFKNEDVGIAFRSYLNMGIEPELNVTTDGGATWTSLTVNGDMYARWFDFIPGTTSTWLGSSSEPGSEGISYSLDDGATWNDLTVGVAVQAPKFMDNETGLAGTWSDGSSTGILIYNGDPIGGGSGAEITEDFEAYNAGGKLVEQALAQGLDYWTCWSGDGGAGGAEDPTVSTDQAFMGNNSVMCSGTNDFVMKFGDKTAGKYSVDFYMYIPSGFVGYYNLLQAWSPGGTGATWGLEIYFNPGGIAEVTAENTTPLETFNYPYDTWFHVENIVNLNQDEASLVIDGTEIVSWQWSVGASGGGLNQLAAMDVYAATTNGTPQFYLDDIQLLELEPPVGPAEITVDPTSFDVSLNAGESTTETLTISNTGVANLVWSAFPDFSMSATNGAAIEPAIDYSNIEIPEVQSKEGLGTPNTGSTDDMVTLNYDGENSSAVGLTNGGTFQFGAKFPTSMTNPYITMEINEVQVFINDLPTASKIYIYGHGSENAPGEVLAEQSFTAMTGWNNITLDTPVEISGGDIWVACEVTHDASLFPAGNDAGPHTTNGDWFKSGASWVPMHIANPDVDANWNIRAVAEGTPMGAWIMIDPSMGETAGGASDDIDVTFDASDLTAGTYNGYVMINSNDPVTPVEMVPVTLTVTGGPALDPPTNLTADLVGTNDVELNWTSPGPAPAFFEGFEGTYPPADWAKISPDGGTGWEQLAVGTTPLPGWTGSGEATAPPDGGDYQAYATWSTGGAAANDQWLVTPQLTVSDGSMLEFYMVYYVDSYLDHVEVLISTTSQTDPAAFDVVVDQIDFPAGSSTDWTLYSYNLTDYVSAGTNVYIAFRENVDDNYNDGSAISIDNVYVGEGSFLAEVQPSVSPKFSVEKDFSTAHVPTNYNHQDNGGSRALLGFNVYRDGTMINDALVTGTTYMDEGLAAGTYVYNVTAVYDEGESGYSNDAEINVPVGIGEIPAEAFSVYPNPANNQVNISSDLELKSVKIMNYTGQVVYSNFTAGNEFQINTSEFAAGVYVIQFETSEGTATSKLVIE